MSTTKTKDLREQSGDDLRKQMSEYSEELLNLRFQHATGALENTSRIREVKRAIARIRTVLTEREADVAPAAAGTEG